MLKSNSLKNDSVVAAGVLIDRLGQFNRRSLDQLNARAYFYYSLAHERAEKLEYIRGTLMQLYQTSCYHHDEMSKSVLLNLCLRNYYHYNLIEQMQVFADKTVAAGHVGDATAGADSVSHNQYCRYLYYIGRAHAVQLEYSKAYSLLSMALRKSPQDYAFGFASHVTKLLVLVQLLMGGIPERSIFNHANRGVRLSLVPYLQLTQAVRAGDITLFNSVADSAENKATFSRDKNLALVRRLGHNVLKTGLKKISVSYSRIAFDDIARKLHLSSAAAAEFICAKAIRDGVIEATIDHTASCLINRDFLDIYSSEEPQKAFHKRIVYCLELHNDAVRAMRYPPCDDGYSKRMAAVEAEENKKKKKDGKDGADKKDGKNDSKSIDEIIKEMEEEDDDMDMD